MIRWNRILSFCFVCIFALGLILDIGLAAPTAFPEQYDFVEPEALQSSQVDLEMLQWAQSWNGDTRTVLLQWREPALEMQLFLPIITSQNALSTMASNSASQMTQYTIYRRIIGQTTWKQVATTTQASDISEMLEILGQPLASYLAWQLRGYGESVSLPYADLYQVLMSESLKVRLLAERYHEISLVRGTAHLDPNAPPDKDVEYYVTGRNGTTFLPIRIRANDILAAPSGLKEVWPGPVELGRVGSTFLDPNWRFRWDHYQQYRQWDASVSLIWNTPSVDPILDDGIVDTPSSLSMWGYTVYRAASGTTDWQRLNQLDEACMKYASENVCMLPINTSSQPNSAAFDEEYWFRDEFDEYKDPIPNLGQIYGEWDYKVCAVDKLHNERCSERITAYSRDLNPPDIVFDVQVSAPGNGAVDISWDYSDLTEPFSPVRFYVTRSPTLTLPLDQWEVVRKQGSSNDYIEGTGPSYGLLDNPPEGNPYWYQIQVRDSAGNWSPPSAPFIGAVFPRIAPPLNSIPYDKNNCAANDMPVTLNGLDSRIVLVTVNRGNTPIGPWTMIKQVPTNNGTAVIADDYLPPYPTDFYYAFEAVDGHGNVSDPQYYCARLNPGTPPPRPGDLIDDVQSEDGNWFIPYQWTGIGNEGQVVVKQPGMHGETTVTANTTSNSYTVDVNQGAWVETTISGANENGAGEGITTWAHPTNNFLNTNRQLTDLGAIQNATWVTDTVTGPAVRLDLTGVCDQCTSHPWVAAYRRIPDGNWLQVTPMQEIPRISPTSDAPWIITDTMDLTLNQTYDYVVLAFSPTSYEMLGVWGPTTLAAYTDQPTSIDFSSTIAPDPNWPSTCIKDSVTPQSQSLPARILLHNGWYIDVNYFWQTDTVSKICAQFAVVDPANLYGVGALSNSAETWPVTFGGIGIDTTTGVQTNGRFVYDFDRTLSGADRFKTHYGAAEFSPGFSRVDILLSLPSQIKFDHVGERSNRLAFLGQNLTIEFGVDPLDFEQFTLVDENLPWQLYFNQGAFETDSVYPTNLQPIETVDRFTYKAEIIGSPVQPDNNLAFMRPLYSSDNAVIDPNGLAGDFSTSEPIAYSTSAPAAVIMSATGANVTIQGSNIKNGSLLNATAQITYLDEETIKDYMAKNAGCGPTEPILPFVLCRGSLSKSPPNYRTLALQPIEPNIPLGPGGLFTSTVQLDQIPTWTRYEANTSRGILFVATAVTVDSPTSWAPMPAENIWSQLPETNTGGDLDPGLNFNLIDNPAAYTCFTPAQFDHATMDLYMRRGGVSEYMLIWENTPTDRLNNYNYTERVIRAELLLLDNTEDPTEPIDFDTDLYLPYPSEVVYPLQIGQIDPHTHCPAGGSLRDPIQASNHQYWSFQNTPLSDEHAWWYKMDGLAKYGDGLSSQEAIFALKGTAVINGLNLQSTVEPGVAVTREIISEWLPDGDTGDIRFLSDALPTDNYRVSGFKYTISDIKLSRYHSTLLNPVSKPSTVGIDLTQNLLDLPINTPWLDNNGNLTSDSLADCAITQAIGCGFVIIEGNTIVEYFGELEKSNLPVTNMVQAIPVDELHSKFPIATNEIISDAIGLLVLGVEARDLWPFVNETYASQFAAYNIPVKFLGNVEGGALVGVLHDASILPAGLPEVLHGDLAATITVDWDDIRGYDDQIGLFAGYTASQAAFRALAMNRPKSRHVLPFDRWESVESDIIEWSDLFGYTLGEGDKDDPVDLAKLIWEEKWCENWDLPPDDPDRQCQNQITDISQTYAILEPILKGMDGKDAYGPIGLGSGSVLADNDVYLNTGMGQATFEIVGLDGLRLEGFYFGTQMNAGPDSIDLLASQWEIDWINLSFSRDGLFIFSIDHAAITFLSVFDYHAKVLFLVDTGEYEHVEGGIETRDFKIPYLDHAEGALIFGAGDYSATEQDVFFVGLRGKVTASDLTSNYSELSLSMIGGLLPSESQVIDDFGYGDLLDKFADENIEGSPAPYIGGYIVATGHWPLVDATCLFDVGGGGELRSWYFYASGAHKWGGQLEAHVTATVGCLVSGRGEAALGVEQLLRNEYVSPPPQENADWGPLPRQCQRSDCFALTGSFWLAIGTGWCSPHTWTSWSDVHWGDSWCYTIGAMSALSYLNPPDANKDEWEFDLDFDFE